MVGSFCYASLVKPADSSNESASGNPYGFAGMRYDGEIGLYHTLYRAYDPDLGRWIEVDPIDYIDGMNLYEYVKDNPVNERDYWGLMTIGEKINAWFAGKIASFAYNWFTDPITFIVNDDENEMTPALKQYIDEFYASQIKGSSGKAKFNESNVGSWLFYSEDVFSTGWWLSTAHRVSTKGSFDYCCSGMRCKLKNVSVNWQWHDEIDADTYKVMMKKTNSWAARIGEGTWDIIGDKLLDTEFPIKVNWQETRKQPIEIFKVR